MMQPQVEDRFLGHTPGADPMSHVPDSFFDRLLQKSQHPDRCEEYRYAMWCEYPDEAYAALMDALYRPQATFIKPTFNDPGSFSIAIHFPCFILGKSVPYIEVTHKNHDTGEEDTDNYAPGVKDIEEHQEGLGKYSIHLKANIAQEQKFVVKIRLDLFGDTKIQLPHEPLFFDNDIEKNEESQTTDGEIVATQHKWVVKQFTFVGHPDMTPSKDLSGQYNWSGF